MSSKPRAADEASLSSLAQVLHPRTGILELALPCLLRHCFAPHCLKRPELPADRLCSGCSWQPCIYISLVALEVHLCNALRCQQLHIDLTSV